MSVWKSVVHYCCSSAASNNNSSSIRNLTEAACPLNFNALRGLVNEAPLKRAFIDPSSQCRRIPEGIRFLRSEYLRSNGSFSPPPETYQACWESYRSFIDEILSGFDIQTVCGYHPEWIFQGCMNVTSLEQFESKFPASKLQELRLHCSMSLEKGFVCDSCTRKLLSLGNLRLNGTDQTENVSDCSADLFMYAAAIVNQDGPTNPGTAKCLLGAGLNPMRSTNMTHHKSLIFGVLLGCGIGLIGAFIAVLLFWMLHKQKEKGNDNLVRDEISLDLGLSLYTTSTNLVKFKIEEIKKATMNFSRHNIIGMGGFGNVYKGMLPDGSEAAFKRFKNCSASGDATFAHEVEIIASVRHVNLVALRGYCTSKICMEGHQRIIVCDLMHNGSLYDHLFGSDKKKLSWTIRKKIALGTARGLAYLHYGVHPAIIHRDIKASNILLDDTFEAKVADFGLAKFNSQGITHLSTKAAGTLGYVAPEYALYGKLTERSDVYSFGVVLLELLSGKKAYKSNERKVSLLTDWAWSLVKEGRALDIIEKNMPELDLPEKMEQYIHIAVICAHPILQARPTMEQIVKMLETNQPVLSTLGAYIAASSSDLSVSSSHIFSTSTTASDELDSDNKDIQGGFRVKILQ